MRRLCVAVGVVGVIGCFLAVIAVAAGAVAAGGILHAVCRMFFCLLVQMPSSFVLLWSLLLLLLSNVFLFYGFAVIAGNLELQKRLIFHTDVHASASRL